MSIEKAKEILKKEIRYLAKNTIGRVTPIIDALAELEAVESEPEPGQKLPELASKEKLIEFLQDERYYHTKEELYALGIINNLQEQINRLQHALPPVIDWYSGLAREARYALEAAESKPEPTDAMIRCPQCQYVMPNISANRRRKVIDRQAEQLNRLQHALAPVIDWYSGLAVERAVDALVADAQKDRQEVFRQAELLKQYRLRHAESVRKSVEIAGDGRRQLAAKNEYIGELLEEWHKASEQLAAKDEVIGLLKKAMLRYAHHEEQCEQYGQRGTAIKCTCGLEQALKGE